MRSITIRIPPGPPLRTTITASADLALSFVGLDPTARVRVVFDDGTIVAERQASELDALDHRAVLRVARSALSRGRWQHETLRVLRSLPSPPHPRAPALDPSGAAFELAATIRVRRASLGAIEASLALAAIALCGAWLAHARASDGAPSSARALADIATALVLLSPIAGRLGLGRSRSTWVAVALAPVALLGAIASQRSTVTVVDRRATPARITRYLPYEVRFDPPSAIVVRGARVPLGPRCALDGSARGERGEARWIITDPLRYREASVEFARALGIETALRCARAQDRAAQCCIELDATGARSIEARPPADWTTGSESHAASPTVTVGRGPRVDRAPRAPSVVHVTAPDSALIASVRSTFAPGVELRWSRAQRARSEGFSLLGAGRSEPFSLTATAVDGETFSVACPADGVFVRLLDAPAHTVSRVTSRDGESLFDDRTGLGATCERERADAEDITIEVPTRNGGGRRYSAAWAGFRYARAPRRNVDIMDADLRAAAGNARCVDEGCPRALRAVRVSRAMIGLRTLELVAPRTRPQALWTANDPSADLAFLCACDRPPRDGSSALDLDLVVTLEDGRRARAQIVNRGGALELVESSAPMPVGPDCCRLSDGSTVECELAAMMMRVPHARRLLPGVRAAGCGAVYALVPGRGLGGR